MGSFQKMYFIIEMMLTYLHMIHNLNETIIGELVRLEPLTLAHVEPLAAIGLDPDLWLLQPRMISTKDEMLEYVQSAVLGQSDGNCFPFVVVESATGKVVGSTRFMDISIPNRRLEIGATWLCKEAQGRGLNTEMKLLMLTSAFEKRNFNKIVFKTEELNTRSRNAIESIGANQEGIFREHLFTNLGRPRNMIYFAMFRDSWPAIKIKLKAKLKEFRC
jgi:RimJ/RimL family protein N-acetyltransferase